MSLDNVRVYLFDSSSAADCNQNGLPDGCDIATGKSQDCNQNGIPDECDIASGFSPDCNFNQVPDECELASGSVPDCNGNAVPDSCDLVSGTSADCNANGIPDECDISIGASNDFNQDGIPDECQCINTHTYCVGGIISTGKSASIGYVGPLSITLNDLSLTVHDCVPNQVGIFFFGSFKTQVPFGDGWLCATGNQQRLKPSVQVNQAGAAAYRIDFTDPSSAAHNIQPLSEWNFQFWYRDPQFAGNGFNLSNALHLHFCP